MEGMRRREFLAGSLAVQGLRADAIQGWDAQRVGANCFNRRVTVPWMDATQAARIQVVRLAYEKWGPRDYLLGSADLYKQLVASHLKSLLAVLDGFAARGIGVVLVPLTLPGARWRQKNGGRRDARLWQDRDYWKQAVRFWQDLARTLKGHPAIAAYDLLNEPAPEVDLGKPSFWKGNYSEWQRSVIGTPGDLNAFYRELVEGIRAVDATVPLMVETGLYATPWAIEAMKTLPDLNVLYSVHMYEPWGFTTWRIHRGAMRYPGPIRIEETGATLQMDAEWVRGFLKPVRQWMSDNRVPPTRMVIGEFGCGRKCLGAAMYLADLLREFDTQGWHWLFYSFREDDWEGMDYELGSSAPPGWYWDAATAGNLHRRYAELYPLRQANPLWSVIADRISGVSGGSDGQAVVQGSGATRRSR